MATVTPPRRFTQSEVLAVFGYEDTQRRQFFEHSEIEGRYMYVDAERTRADEDVDALNARFQAGALELGEAAARRALAKAGWQPVNIDFLATTTCTGRLTPSVDAHLVARLGCRSDVQRVHVGDTGCASAMVALQQAWNHLHAFPDHRALVIAVEVCSATYFLDDRLESAVAVAALGSSHIGRCSGRNISGQWGSNIRVGATASRCPRRSGASALRCSVRWPRS